MPKPDYECSPDTLRRRQRQRRTATLAPELQEARQLAAALAREAAYLFSLTAAVWGLTDEHRAVLRDVVRAASAAREEKARVAVSEDAFCFR